MSESIYDKLPGRVSVPIPYDQVLPRGVHALGATSKNVNMRFDMNTWRLVKEVSDQFDMTIANFIRWSAKHLALEIIKQLEQADDNDDSVAGDRSG